MILSLKRLPLQLALGMLLSLTAFAQETGGPFNVTVGELSLSAPAGWYQAAVPYDEPNVRSVIASDEPEDVQAVLLISVIPKRGRTLEAYNAMTRNFIVTRMDGVVEYERSKAVDGYPAHTFVYEGRSEHSAQGRRKFMRTVIDKGANFYVLQGVADHVPFAARAGMIEGMVNSITWNN
jgi:hypothetical protein